MTEYRFRTAVRAFLARRPFRAFKIRLNCGTRFQIRHPENMNVRDGIVTFHVPGEPPIQFVFDRESVSMVYDADEPPDR